VAVIRGKTTLSCQFKKTAMNISKALFFCLFAIGCYAQPSPLDKPISIKITNERLEDALRKISEASDVQFSYNPAQFDLERRVSLTAQKRPLKLILDELLKETATYKQKKGYIILQKKESNPDTSPKEIYINGYIYDGVTGDKIAQASIFERRTLASAISNHYGYYRIKLPVGMASTQLEVRKEQYWRESVKINGRKTVDVTLKPIKKAIPTLEKPIVKPDTNLPKVITTPSIAKPDSIKTTAADSNKTMRQDTVIAKRSTKETIQNGWKTIEKTFVDALASAKQAIHIQNISDTLYRPWQVSLLPYIGTNHVLSGNVINNISWNIIAGYSLGIDGLEVGGVLNMVRWDMNGFQASGVANLVGRDVNGFQMAGTLNVVAGSLDGFQLAGFGNISGKNSHGWQLASFGNLAWGNHSGTQVSGVANIVGQNLRGWQIGYFNYAKTVEKGHQLGLINYADSSATTPLGIFSVVRRNGYRRLEFSVDELNFVNATFKTGVKRLYNIFTAGASFELFNRPFASTGYGLGTAFRWGKTWMFNLDAVQNMLFYVSDGGLSHHTRLSASIEKKLSPTLALAVGPSANWLMSNSNIATTRPQPYPVQMLADGRIFSSWVGFQFSLRFCNRGQ
jgi:hypothetical protein